MKGLANIEKGYTQLQLSAALVEHSKKLRDETVVNKILCCPRLKGTVISTDAAQVLTTENVFIVCNENEKFDSKFTGMSEFIER